MSINIRRNTITITYIHINISINISICVFVGISTNITLNMNRVPIFVGTLELISVSVLLKVSEFVKGICIHID